MSVSTSTVAGFAEEARVLLKIAANLGKYRRQDQRERFESSLAALRMERDEVAQHWDNIVLDTEANGCDDVDWSRVKCNTDLAGQLGILLDSETYPRNLLLYRLMALHFPEFFEVLVTGTRHIGGSDSRGNPPERRLVVFPRQPIGKATNGRVGALSVHRTLSGVEPSRFSERVVRAANPLCSALDNDLGLELAELLIGCKMQIPELKTAQQLARVIRSGINGDPVTIVGAFCPDWAYEETDDPHLPYRYTFDGVGEGVGLVAQQFVRIVPAISAWLDELDIEHRIILSIGDFEADSEGVLERVGVNRQEFLRRCQCSLDRFAEAVPADLPLELEMFDGGRSRGRFRKYAEDATRKMMAGNFGRMVELHNDLLEVLARIPDQYRTFYKRWFGGMSDDNVRRIVYEQGGEYAALARIYEEDFGSNILMLSGDRPEMHLFNVHGAMLPTLCAKRAY